jgi:hypothetical protein
MPLATDWKARADILISISAFKTNFKNIANLINEQRPFKWRRATRHNNTQYNDTQYNNTRYRVS